MFGALVNQIWADLLQNMAQALPQHEKAQFQGQTWMRNEMERDVVTLKPIGLSDLLIC